LFIGGWRDGPERFVQIAPAQIGTPASAFFLIRAMSSTQRKIVHVCASDEGDTETDITDRLPERLLVELLWLLDRIEGGERLNSRQTAALNLAHTLMHDATQSESLDENESEVFGAVAALTELAAGPSDG
jgi:hypothetical protein